MISNLLNTLIIQSGLLNIKMIKTGKLHQQFAALAEKLSTVPRTHLKWLNTACDSSYGGSNALFWPL